MPQAIEVLAYQPWLDLPQPPSRHALVAAFIRFLDTPGLNHMTIRTEGAVVTVARYKPAEGVELPVRDRQAS